MLPGVKNVAWFCFFSENLTVLKKMLTEFNSK